MKREDESGQADGFEAKMAGFRRVAPPESWRGGLIANALPAGEEERGTRFGWTEKMLGYGIAAAWVAIAAMSFSLPSGGGVGKESGERASLRVEQTTVLAWRNAWGGEIREMDLY